MPQGSVEKSISEILSRINIIDIIGEYVTLKRAGRDRYVGLCPFHSETAPSFNVDAKKGLFYCFGCKKGGNVITFVSEIQGISRWEAIERLAARAGVELPQKSQKGDLLRKERETLAAVLTRAEKAFRELYYSEEGKIARDYVNERGIQEETVESFGLGYGGDMDFLIAELQEISGGIEAGKRAGLLGGMGQVYNRFHHRLIFPIRGTDQSVKGFGGRILVGDDGPKYLNTNQTPLFNKGNTLFGLDLAYRSIREKKFAILVEGNFDVLAMHQAGFKNTVAPLGTAVTKMQLEALRRLGDRLIVLFDGDSAGRKAALRLIGMTTQVGLPLYVGVLPEGEDPDSILRGGKKDIIEQAIERAVPILNYFVTEFFNINGSGSEAKLLLLKEFNEILQDVRSNLVRDSIISKLSELIGMDIRTIKRGLTGIRKELGNGNVDLRISESSISGTEIELMGWLLAEPALVDQLLTEDFSQLIKDEQVRQVIQDFIDAETEGRELVEVLLNSQLSQAIKDRVMKFYFLTKEMDQQDIYKGFAAVTLRLKIRDIEKQIDDSIKIAREQKEKDAFKRVWQLRQEKRVLEEQLETL